VRVEARILAGSATGFSFVGAVFGVRYLDFDFDVLAFDSNVIAGDAFGRGWAEDAAGSDIKDGAMPGGRSLQCP
jgi:hypothetical protein